MQTEITKKYIGRRGWATFIDYTLIWILFFCYVYLAGDKDTDGTYSIHGWPVLIPWLAWFLYFVVAENVFGGTAGHLLLGLKVRALDNRRISFLRTLLRRIADILEITWCFGLLAWLIAKNTPNSQRLGDLLAKTTVIGEKETTGDFEFDFEKAADPV